MTDLVKAARQFDGRLVMLGLGTIGGCALPLVLELLGLPRERILLLDREHPERLVGDELAEGLDTVRRDIRRGTIAASLGDLVRPGDLLLNLSVGIDSIELADWCHGNGVLYVDTALEVWEDLILDPSQQPPAKRTEYALHQRARRQAQARWRADGPTAVVTHGANPGLVSHFAKAALLDLAAALDRDATPPATRAGWAALARDCGVKVIHISERDNQIAREPRQPDEFVNTWSVPGFVEEAMMPAELGWGSHEKRLPEGARGHDEGPANAIYFERPAAQVLLRSWVPLGGQIAGLALPHSESITLSDYLTLRDGGGLLYRPTVAFVYLACDAAMASLHEMMMRDWQMPPRERVMDYEILDGRDELGVLLLGHPLTAWWLGSQLDIHRARRILPGNNPTAIQVAIGAVAATAWAMANPARGYCEPEDLPHQMILDLARHYLEPITSQASDWTPLKQRTRLFDEPWLDRADPWQFCNFLAR